MSNLLRLSEAACMGLHTMVLLAADPDRPVSAKAAAGLMKVSEAHLAKVMGRLAQAGLVKSIRGPKGGFVLSRQSETITLLEVYEALEGSMAVRACLFGTQLCDGQKCIFGDLLESVDTQVRRYFSRTRLSQLVAVVESVLRNVHKGSGGS